MHRCITGTQDFTSGSPSDTFVPGSPTGKTNKKTSQPQASISSTETARLSYKLPFKGPVIECMGLRCVLPRGICLSRSLPQQALLVSKQFSGRSSLALPALTCPRRPHALPSPTKRLHKELRRILTRFEKEPRLEDERWTNKIQRQSHAWRCWLCCFLHLQVTSVHVLKWLMCH